MQNLEVIRGDDEKFEFSFAEVDGTPIDLTGSTVFFTVKSNKTDPDSSAVIQKEITSFDTPTTGRLILDLTNVETGIAVGEYLYDIQLVKAGKVTSSGVGRFIVMQDITTDTS